MRKSEFMRLPEFEDTDDTSCLNIGDKFLYGKSVIGQKQTRHSGEEIVFYVVISKNQHGIEYGPMYEYLEKDKGEEK